MPLTPGSPNSPGSSLGQIAETNPLRRNFLTSTSDFAQGWSNVGMIVVDQVFGKQIDQGYVLQTLTGLNGVNSVEEQVLIAGVGAGFDINVNSPCTASIYIASNLAFTSNQCRLGIRFTGGAAFDAIADFNPVTGQIIGSSNITGSSVSSFSTNSQDGTPITGLRISITATPVTSNTFVGYFFVPQSNGVASGTIVVGGPQLEQGPVVTNFIASPIGQSFFRLFGTLTRTAIDYGRFPHLITANYVIDPIADLNNLLEVSSNAVSLTLPATVSSGNVFQQGTLRKWGPGDGVTILYRGPSLNINNFCVISTTGGKKIFGTGLPIAGVTTLNMPYDGNTIGLYNTTGITIVANNNGDFNVVSTEENHGEQLLPATGTFNCPLGVTAVWIDGAAGGAGGGGSAATGAAGGGGGGQAVAGFFVSVSPGTAYAVGIGTGGNGGAAGNNNGVDGGNTTFGVLLTLSGGNHGNGAAAAATGLGGVSVGQGSGPGSFGKTAGGFGVGGDGGGSTFAPTNLSSNTAGGVTGIVYGGGGTGGGITGGAGGNGASGFIRVRW